MGLSCEQPVNASDSSMAVAQSRFNARMETFPSNRCDRE
jgi:hypothetical protein